MQPVSPSATRYDRFTIVLHWLVALLVALQWLGAQTIDWFPSGWQRVDARSAHITSGLILLLLVAARVVWRATGGRRLPPADRPALHVVAKATHWTLYVLLAGTLALGVMNVWVRGDVIWNLFTVPAYDPADRALRHQVGDLHGLAANLILILAGIHAGAALVHRLVWRDGVLGRMMFGRAPEHPGAQHGVEVARSQTERA